MPSGDCRIAPSEARSAVPLWNKETHAQPRSEIGTCGQLKYLFKMPNKEIDIFRESIQKYFEICAIL